MVGAWKCAIAHAIVVNILIASESAEPCQVFSTLFAVFLLSLLAIFTNQQTIYYWKKRGLSILLAIRDKIISEFRYKHLQCLDSQPGQKLLLP